MASTQGWQFQELQLLFGEPLCGLAPGQHHSLQFLLERMLGESTVTQKIPSRTQQEGKQKEDPVSLEVGAGSCGSPGLSPKVP